MMHGYLVFDKDENQLVPYRTWRNTTTGQASAALTELFGFNIPQRWSTAHLYQAVLNKEEHVKDIALLTTLAGYIHRKLTGENVMGLGEVSGMFPVDSTTCDYDTRRVAQFEDLLKSHGVTQKFADIYPKALKAGEPAGVLTSEGAKLLDPTGVLSAGILLAPPEGDAGTGMVATNSVAERTGNVSAGTSIFTMLVLEKALSKVYPEIDMVTTPAGRPVAMVHCNNCSSDIDAWADVFCGFSEATGKPCSRPEALTALFNKALEGDADCGGLLNYNYISGEHITHVESGRPMLIRKPAAAFNFANFARTQLYSALATMRFGMDILFEQENMHVDAILGHGGFFKVPGVGQKIMAAALGTKVSVMETAGEGGPWGMAILAAYLVNKAPGETLEAYLEKKVFAEAKCDTVEPDQDSVKGFSEFMTAYKKALPLALDAAKMFN
jgi:sugar (pentulose or hexulose) kinase